MQIDLKQLDYFKYAEKEDIDKQIELRDPLRQWIAKYKNEELILLKPATKRCFESKRSFHKKEPT